MHCYARTYLETTSMINFNSLTNKKEIKIELN